jgi:hypothetical protein
MTLLQNQALEAHANVLHDQGVPNTLGGMTLPVPIGYGGLSVGSFVVVAGAIMLVVVILVGRLA